MHTTSPPRHPFSLVPSLPAPLCSSFLPSSSPRFPPIVSSQSFSIFYSPLSVFAFLLCASAAPRPSFHAHPPIPVASFVLSIPSPSLPPLPSFSSPASTLFPYKFNADPYSPENTPASAPSPATAPSSSRASTTCASTPRPSTPTRLPSTRA
ncbi:hypothetical protein B0H14DRAFT_915932 [Mycena olivaceomarginata]|nr:hypothetical protein B0H14DRAFT_915932 [Mycena olivaceomarginata]